MAERLRFVTQALIQSGRDAPSLEHNHTTLMSQRLREMSRAIPGSSRKLAFREFRDRPPGDCGYAEGIVELADGSRHKCCGGAIKGALNGFCVIYLVVPDEAAPVEFSALFTLGYAVGIAYFQWADGTLLQLSLEDSVLVTAGHDRFIYASFPAVEPALSRAPHASAPGAAPHAFKRPSDHEFVVFVEPPANSAFSGTSLGLNKAIDISHSCRVAQELKKYVISEVEAGNGRMDKGILIVPEDSLPWIEVTRKLGAKQDRDTREYTRMPSRAHDDSASVRVTSGADHRNLNAGSEDFDFALWCLLLLGQDSWQSQKRKEEAKVEVGSAGNLNEKRECWTLFDYKLADPSHMICKAIIRTRSATGVYDSSIILDDISHDSPEHFNKGPPSVVGSSDTRVVSPGPGLKMDAAFNLRCIPLFLRSVYIWQDKQSLSENIILKGSGYRILIKAARNIKERFEKAANQREKTAALRYRSETLPVLLRLLPHVLHQVQDENWSTFTMSLEFAWWLSEIAPVALNMSGLHVLSCARVLGCRPFSKMTLSQTLIDPKSFGRGNSKLSVGTLCLRAFQMLDLKGQASFDGDGDKDGDIGPLRLVIRQEALPLAIRLLGANFQSQESILSFSNILTDIKLNPANFLGLSNNLINLLKAHKETGIAVVESDQDDPQNISEVALILKGHIQVVSQLQQHFDSCQNIVEVLLCLFRNNPLTFCTAEAADGILGALQDMLLECLRVFKIYSWCQDHLVSLSTEQSVDEMNETKKKPKKQDAVVIEDLAEFKQCARSCADVAQLITFEATRLLRLINSIAQLTPHVIQEYLLAIEEATKTRITVSATIFGIFCTVLSELTRLSNQIFRDHRLPVTERIDVSYILKNITACNFCCLVCIHHITSHFAIEISQQQVYKFSVCAFAATGSGVEFLSLPIRDRTVKKYAAFKEVTDLSADDISPLKSVLEALIIGVMLNLAHAAHTGEVPQYVNANDVSHNRMLANMAPSRFGVLSPITKQHREILNQLMLWCVRGGGMDAAAAALVASFAQAQHFLPHRLMVRVLLQKNACIVSPQEFVAMSNCDLDDVHMDTIVARLRDRNTPSVTFLHELVRWIDPSYAAELSTAMNSSFSSVSLESSSFVTTSVFNINGLPPQLQQICQVCVTRWREFSKLEKVSDEFQKIFRDSRDIDWTVVLQGCETTSSPKISDNAAGDKISGANSGNSASTASKVRRHADIEEVSRMLNSKLNIDPALGQRHLSQSMNAFHYFCGMNNANGYIPFLIEMMPRMRELSLPLLSKIPIPYKMVIASPYLLTGVARTLELEIAAYDEEKKDQVALGRFLVRRPLLWIKWMLWTTHLFSLGKLAPENDQPNDLWTTYWAPWSKPKGGKGSQTRKPWHYDKTEDACDKMTALNHFLHVRHLHRACCTSSDVSFLQFISEPFFDETEIRELKRDLDHGRSMRTLTSVQSELYVTSHRSVKTSPMSPSSRFGFYQAVSFEATEERAGWVLSNKVELKPWVEENFTIFASAVGNSPLSSIVLHCFVDKKKSIGPFSNKVRRWLVLFGDSLEWFEPEEAAKFATAGFAEGRHRARSSGVIKFGGQGHMDIKVERSGDKAFRVSVPQKKPREFELLTKPTDFEMSESLKLLLQGAFSKTHAVDAKRWIDELLKYYHAASHHK